MGNIPRLDEIGRLVGDPSRAEILAALMDGRAWTGRELAHFAHVSPSTASSHLQRLVRGELLSVLAQGRNRYYRIASPHVASALESLMALAPARAPRHPSERRIANDMAAARFCYDHLAGKLGVSLTDALLADGAIAFTEGTGTLTDSGVALFGKLGISLEATHRGRRPICRPCLDWSERRPHLAGVAGSALGHAALERDWVERKRNSRALSVTRRGVAALKDLFGIDLVPASEE
jgi:DNA-binding transcriptional ArsR family regulator